VLDRVHHDDAGAEQVAGARRDVQRQYRTRGMPEHERRAAGRSAHRRDILDFPLRVVGLGVPAVASAAAVVAVHPEVFGQGGHQPGGQGTVKHRGPGDQDQCGPSAVRPSAAATRSRAGTAIVQT
jgi:hypothetical protein